MRGVGLCLVVVLLAAVSGISKAEEKEFVLTLDHSNFSEVVSKHDFVLVEFYAPWCGHCKQLAPEFEKAASVLSKHDPPVVLAKVDANEEVNKGISKLYGVRGYPTLKVFRNGAKDVQDFKGARDADGIVQAVKKLLGPASVEIKSADDAASIIDLKKVFIVGIFSKFSGEEYEKFTQLAEKLRSDYDFGHTLDAKVLPRGDSSVSGPVIRLFKPFDELVVDSKDFDIDAAQKFIETEDVPSLVVFDEDPINRAYLGKMFSGENTKVVLLLNYSSENADSLKAKFADAAYLLKGGKLGFLVGDLEPSKPLLNYFRVEESQAPLVFVQSGKKKYLKTHVKPEELVPWLKTFLDNKAEPFVVSQPIPTENNEPVKVVVLDSLQDMVLKSGKDVLLEFYAPWCGHCKSLAPILDEVAISYEKDPNVLIAKFDATANDIPEAFEVQGYPTMYFVSSKGDVIEYDGGRAAEDITEFIQKHRVTEGAPEKKSEPVKEEQEDEPAPVKDEL